MYSTVSKQLVQTTINKWNARALRADNTTAITIYFEFPDRLDDEEDQLSLASIREWRDIGLRVTDRQMGYKPDLISSAYPRRWNPYRQSKCWHYNFTAKANELCSHCKTVLEQERVRAYTSEQRVYMHSPEGPWITAKKSRSELKKANKRVFQGDDGECGPSKRHKMEASHHEIGGTPNKEIMVKTVKGMIKVQIYNFGKNCHPDEDHKKDEKDQKDKKDDKDGKDKKDDDKEGKNDKDEKDDGLDLEMTFEREKEDEKTEEDTNDKSNEDKSDDDDKEDEKKNPDYEKVPVQDYVEVEIEYKEELQKASARNEDKKEGNGEKTSPEAAEKSSDSSSIEESNTSSKDTKDSDKDMASSEEAKESDDKDVASNEDTKKSDDTDATSDKDAKGLDDKDATSTGKKKPVSITSPPVLRKSPRTSSKLMCLKDSNSVSPLVKGRPYNTRNSLSPKGAIKYNTRNSLSPKGAVKYNTRSSLSPNGGVKRPLRTVNSKTPGRQRSPAKAILNRAVTRSAVKIR